MIGSPEKKKIIRENAFEHKRKGNSQFWVLRITRPRYAGVVIYGMHHGTLSLLTLRWPSLVFRHGYSIGHRDRKKDDSLITTEKINK